MPGAPYQTHLGRSQRQAELDAELCAWTATLSSSELLKRLGDAGIPGGRIYTSRDIAADEHYAARDMIVETRSPPWPARRCASRGWSPS